MYIWFYILDFPKGSLLESNQHAKCRQNWLQVNTHGKWASPSKCAKNKTKQGQVSRLLKSHWTKGAWGIQSMWMWCIDIYIYTPYIYISYFGQSWFPQSQSKWRPQCVQPGHMLCARHRTAKKRVPSWQDTVCSKCMRSKALPWSERHQSLSLVIQQHGWPYIILQLWFLSST